MKTSEEKERKNKPFGFPVNKVNKGKSKQGGREYKVNKTETEGPKKKKDE